MHSEPNIATPLVIKPILKIDQYYKQGIQQQDKYKFCVVKVAFWCYGTDQS